MPQLTDQLAKAAEAEAWDPDSEPTGSFQVLPPGDYLFILNEVTVSDRPGPSGSHYWTWIIEHPESKSRIWEVTSLAPSAVGKLGQVFAAFGVPASTPTEDLLGEYVGVTVDVEPITNGKHAGKLDKNGEPLKRNVAVSFWPASEHDDYDVNEHGSHKHRQVSQASDFGAGDDEPVPQTGRRRAKSSGPATEEAF